MSMFCKYMLITLTGQVINVTSLTTNELFTLDLAFEVRKQPIWELFCALFIYLCKSQPCTANALAKLPSDWLCIAEEEAEHEKNKTTN